MRSITIYTDGGMRQNCAGWGFWAMDFEEKEFHGWGTAGTNVSNNVAELVACINALRFAIEEQYTSIHLFMDAEYVIGGMNKIQNGIFPTTNFELWDELEKLRNVIHNKEIVVTFDWVKGHSDVKGNEMADQLATRGVLAQKNDQVVTSIERIKKGKDINGEVVAIEPFNPMITGRELYFRTNISSQIEDDRYFYCSATFTRDDTNPAFFAGKNESDSHYSLLLTKNNIAPLETLKEMFSKKVGDEISHVLLQLPVLKKDITWREMTINPLHYAAMNGLMLQNPANEMIGSIVKPPLQIFKMVGFFDHGLALIERFEKNNPELLTFDVTDYFVSMNGKGKREIRKDFTQNEKSIVFKHIGLISGRHIDVRLNVGIDMPTRNQISNMIKMDPNQPITFHLLVWGVCERSYHCAMLIKREDMVGVYYTSDASYRIMPP